jgi:hypothetical protein
MYLLESSGRLRNVCSTATLLLLSRLRSSRRSCGTDYAGVTGETFTFHLVATMASAAYPNMRSTVTR